MNYVDFKRKVVEELPKHLPDDCKGMDLAFTEDKKVNQTLDGIGFADKQTPVIYINDMYSCYSFTHDFEKSLQMAADTMAGLLRKTA